MSKVSRRDFLRASGVAATGILLVACAPAIPAAAPSAGESGGTGATPATEQLTIRYGRWANPAEIKAGEALIEKFESTQSEIKVEPAFLPWEDYWPKIQSELAAGTAPDVI